MTRETPDERLAWFKQNKSNRSYEECKSLLEMHGFVARDETKNHVLYKCGTQTVTVSKPHGRDKTVLMDQVRQILRAIDAAVDELKEDLNDE